MSPLLAIVAFTATGPLDRLVGDWTSLESVETAAGKKALHLKGKNRWIFESKLLEIHETYTVDGDPKPGENHILVQAQDNGKLAAWWYAPSLNEPLIFDGTSDADGMTLTRKDGHMRIVYKWDGDGAYDAKLQTRKGEEEWADRTIARYTKRK